MPFWGTVIFSLFLLWQGSIAQNGANMSTIEKLLVIGIPTNSFSSKFVQIDAVENSVQGKRFTGFSIRVFEEAIKLLEYKLYYKFVEFNGTYDDLVASVANKTFDAAVGDITITEERWEFVQFTVPYTESSLSVVVPTKPAQGWIFFRPFTPEMWMATGGIMAYTMFVVWFLEHRSNPDFGGSWHHQLGNALWFTFTSLFFAHREKIKSNHTRVVVVVWLFVVLILTQSFTASLTSMLTVTRLNPNVDLLMTKDATVGCNTLNARFVEKELGYEGDNIKLMRIEKDYLDAFKSGTISAVILDLPYAKLLVNGHCKDFATTGSSYNFGGLSFAFQKGSPVASDVSKTILKLSENGMLKRLEESWLTSSKACSIDSQATQNTVSLSLQSFWGLFLFSVTLTTFSFLLFIARLVKNHRKLENDDTDDEDEDDDESFLYKTVRIVRYLKNAELGSGGKVSSSSKVETEIQTFEVFDNQIFQGPDYIVINIEKLQEEIKYFLYSLHSPKVKDS